MSQFLYYNRVVFALFWTAFTVKFVNNSNLDKQFIILRQGIAISLQYIFK